jgi:hypothetical protein
MESKAQAIGRFILALIIVGGVTTGLIWANCNDKPAVHKTVVEEVCPGGPAEIEHGTVLEWGKKDDYPKKGEMVTFEGYVAMPNMTYLNGGTYLVTLAYDSTLEDYHLTMMIWEGDCENTMKPIPNDYDDSDLLILGNSGEKIKHGDKVRVTGKVKDDGAMFMFFVKRIEKI